MAGSELYSAFKDVVVAANGSRAINVVGVYASVLAANLDFNLGFDDDPVQFITQGLTIGTRDGSTFKSVRIENPNGTALTVTLAFGVGQIRDSRLSASAPLNLAKSQSVRSVPDVSVGAAATATVVAADTARRRVIVVNLSANAREIRIGDAGVGAAEGHELLPGQRIELDTAGAVTAYNPHTAAQSLSVLEVLD